jgi:hypothetical protein
MNAPRPVVPMPAETAPALATPAGEGFAARPALVTLVDLPGTSQPPVIRVTIGRIEVRAVMAPAAPAPLPSRKTPTGTLSLEEYLKQRSEGKR